METIRFYIDGKLGKTLAVYDDRIVLKGNDGEIEIAFAVLDSVSFKNLENTAGLIIFESKKDGKHLSCDFRFYRSSADKEYDELRRIMQNVYDFIRDRADMK